MLVTTNLRHAGVALLCTLRMLLIAALPAAVAGAPGSEPGKLEVDGRLRSESVDDSRYAETAVANTVRLHLKATSPRVDGFAAVVGLEAVNTVGTTTFDDTLNHRSQYPVVADPQSREVDEAYVSYRNSVLSTQPELWAGRRWLAYDNSRHVGGGPAWRQNYQSFDGLGLDAAPWKDARLQFDHVVTVHRPLGSHSANGEENLRGELVALSSPVPALGGKATAMLYGYWLDFREAQPFPATSSIQTQGASLNGIYPLSSVSVPYRVELAWQSPYADGASSNHASYRRFMLGVEQQGTRLQLDHEHLGGSGRYGFQTPLAALHAFDGWADRFLKTPVDGLDDNAITLSHTWPRCNAALSYHRFSAAFGRYDYGQEWDVMAGCGLGRYGRVVAKWADYHSASEAEHNPHAVAQRGDTQKLWLQWEWQWATPFSINN